MTTLALRAALVAGCASLGLAGLALAAPPVPADGPKAEKIFRDDRDRGGPRRFHRDPEAHARHLRDVLQLTPAQEPALKAFLDGVKPGPRPTPEERPAPRSAPMTTPERLDRQAEMMVRHKAAFDRRAAATRTFYAQLTPSQRKAFDALRLDGRGFGCPRVHRLRHGPGARPMVFGPDDDILIGGFDGGEGFDALDPPPEPVAMPGG
jgi:protein CpxP